MCGDSDDPRRSFRVSHGAGYVGYSSSDMRILITGATGLLAPYLIEACKKNHTVFTTARTDSDYNLDLELKDSAYLLPDADVVIHAAAMTNVDQCQEFPYAALHANRGMTKTIASANIERIVYISTDQVYPDTPGPHKEGGRDPINYYGKTKLEGERILWRRDNSLILRTNFFGRDKWGFKTGFVEFLLEELYDRPESLVLYRDLFFSPLHMSTLAQTIVELIERGIRGTYNLGSRNGCSKAHFAFLMAKHLNIPREGVTVDESPSWRVPRAHDLRLDVTKLEGVLGRDMPTLEEEIKKI